MGMGMGKGCTRRPRPTRLNSNGLMLSTASGWQVQPRQATRTRTLHPPPAAPPAPPPAGSQGRQPPPHGVPGLTRGPWQSPCLSLATRRFLCPREVPPVPLYPQRVAGHCQQAQSRPIRNAAGIALSSPLPASRTASPTPRTAARRPDTAGWRTVRTLDT